MKIGIISDIHGSITAFDTALRVFGDLDILICAGDVLYHGPRNPLPKGHSPQKLAEQINNLSIPFITVKGNCDADVDQMMLSVPILSPYALCHFENRSYLITHGHKTNKENLYNLALKWNIDLIITGHTHVKVLEKRSNIIFINPGSCSLPKDGIASVAIIEDKKIKLIDLKTSKILKEMLI